MKDLTLAYKLRIQGLEMFALTISLLQLDPFVEVQSQFEVCFFHIADC
jgi:hypothetical protein